jgi:hypothetical protein
MGQAASWGLTRQFLIMTSVVADEGEEVGCLAHTTTDRAVVAEEPSAGAGKPPSPDCWATSRPDMPQFAIFPLRRAGFTPRRTAR